MALQIQSKMKFSLWKRVFIFTEKKMMLHRVGPQKCVPSPKSALTGAFFAKKKFLVKQIFVNRAFVARLSPSG